MDAQPSGRRIHSRLKGYHREDDAYRLARAGALADLFFYTAGKEGNGRELREKERDGPYYTYKKTQEEPEQNYNGGPAGSLSLSFLEASRGR